MIPTGTHAAATSSSATPAACARILARLPKYEQRRFAPTILALADLLGLPPGEALLVLHDRQAGIVRLSKIAALSPRFRRELQELGKLLRRSMFM